MRSRQRLFKVSGGIVAVVLAMATAGCGGDDSDDDGGSSGAGTKVSLRLDWLPTGYQAIFYYGIDQGIYSDAGIDLSVSDGKGSSSTIQSVAAGQDDFGFAAMPVLAQSATTITNVKMVCGVLEKTPNAIIALGDSGITQPSDLAGKTQGYTPGGETVPATAFEATNDVDPSSVKKVAVAAGAEVSALLSHKVDFINEWAFDEGLQVLGEDPDATLMKFGDYGVEVMGSGIIVNTSTIDDDPDLVQSFVDATQKSMEATASDPQAAYDAFVKARPTAPDISLENLKQSIDYYHSENTDGDPDCSIAPEDVQGTQDILQQYADLPSSVDVSSLVDSEFVS
jgi:NitT/TauT family transport system substrate-binding protein